MPELGARLSDFAGLLPLLPGVVGVTLAILAPLLARRTAEMRHRSEPRARRIQVRYTIAYECMAGMNICLTLGALVPSSIAHDVLTLASSLLGFAFLFIFMFAPVAP